MQPVERTIGPFPGPRAFRAEEGIYFFGRDRDAVDLANMVAACPLTVVYGASGSGKSSLINARLGHALEDIEPFWKVINFASWHVGFEFALLDLIGRELPQPVFADGPAASVPVTMPDLAARLITFARESRQPVALVFDQFEEYFLYNRTGMEFQQALARLANRRSSPVHLVLCLRSDRLFLLDKLRAHIPEILQNLYIVDPLGAEGARRAVNMPVQAYGEAMNQPFSVEPELADALVGGSSEREIFRRLPLHGRGEAVGAAADGCQPGADAPMRIVAPFLQLALEAIWREDVVVRGQTCLRLQTLRDLACGRSETAREALVGKLVQQHFDTVLSQRTPEEQDVCARLFDRMVTYSGTKVAIAFPTDLSALTSRQLTLAKDLLEWLSVPGPGRFVRPVAADEPGADHAAGDTRRYEIVHDALAVPILDWVARRREQAAVADAAAQAAEREADERTLREIAEARQQSERASREAAEAKAAQERTYRRMWQIGAVLGVLSVLVLAGYGYLTGEYQARRTDLNRFLRFASTEKAPEFRMRLLLEVAALNRSSGLWSFVFRPERNEARQLIKTVLMRSPRLGGEYIAASVDNSGSRLVRLVSGDPDQGLQVIELGSEAPAAAFPLPPQFNVTEATSRIPSLHQAPMISVGFVDKLSAPVLIKQGLLYYRAEGAGPSDWQKIDLADLVPEKMQSLPNPCFPDVVAGSVQVTCVGIGWREYSVVRLRPVATSGHEMWARITQIATIRPEESGRLSLTTSPSLSTAPQDRWATVYRSNANGSAAMGQLSESGITVGRFDDDRTTSVAWPELTEKPQDLVQQAFDSNGATANPSVGFSNDGSSALFRRGPKIFVASLPPAAAGTPLVTIPANHQSFDVPNHLPGRVMSGLWNQRSLLAAVRLQEDGPAKATGGAQWRFAWPIQGGLVVTESRENDSMLSIREPWAAGSRNPADAPMYADMANLRTLNFSTDGRFLTLISPERRSTKIWVWDLGSEQVANINGLRSDEALVDAACKAAALGIGGSTFDAGEKITWIGVDAPQPCGS